MRLAIIAIMIIVSLISMQRLRMAINEKVHKRLYDFERLVSKERYSCSREKCGNQPMKKIHGALPLWFASGVSL
jgi:hypothetical protein